MRFLVFSLLKQKLLFITKRFPFILSVLFVFIVVVLIGIHNDLSLYYLGKIGNLSLSLVLTFFFALALCLSAESFCWSMKKSLGLQLLSVMYGIFFFFSLSVWNGRVSSFVFLFLSFFGIISYLFAAPYINKTTKKDAYYSYFYRVTTAFLLSFVVGIVLFGLGGLLLSAIDALLFSIPKNLWDYWFIISCVIFAPLFGLLHIPSKNSFDDTKVVIGRFPSFLITYVLLPFVAFCSVIFCLYSIVVLTNFDQWVQGEIIWFIIGFSLSGYMVYIYSYIFEKRYWFIRFFRKYFPYAVIPQIFLLFFTISSKIDHYGLTTNRYFVVVFGIFVLGISLYYIFSQRKALKAFPLALVRFVILVSVGPWSVYQLPQWHQLSFLVVSLEQAGMLKDGVAVPLDTNRANVDHKIINDINSRIKYLCRVHSCYSLQHLVPKVFEENDYTELWDVRGSSGEIIGKDILNYLSVG